MKSEKWHKWNESALIFHHHFTGFPHRTTSSNSRKRNFHLSQYGRRKMFCTTRDEMSIHLNNMRSVSDFSIIFNCFQSDCNRNQMKQTTVCPRIWCFNKESNGVEMNVNYANESKKKKKIGRFFIGNCCQNDYYSKRRWCCRPLYSFSKWIQWNWSEWHDGNVLIMMRSEKHFSVDDQLNERWTTCLCSLMHRMSTNTTKISTWGKFLFGQKRKIDWNDMPLNIKYVDVFSCPFPLENVINEYNFILGMLLKPIPKAIAKEKKKKESV